MNNFKENEPLVSIVMTCFNNQTTLKDAISSVINQSYQNWEIIFVDDGSTDQSIKIVRQVSDKRIKIFSLDKNYGRGVSYQKGLNEANGLFVMFLDSDDWWYSNKIAKQLDYLEKNKKVMFVGSGLITSENYNPIGVRCNKILSKITLKNINDPPIAFATICVRKELISKYSFDKNLKVAQDIDFLRTLCLNETFSNLDNILYVYNENISFNWIKIKNAWKNTKIGLRKYKKIFFINYYINVFKINLKLFLYFILFLMKMEKLLLYYRVNTPSVESLKLYNKEKNMMLNMKSRIFKN